MKHSWRVIHYPLQSMMQEQVRVCAHCRAVQAHTTDYAWMRVVGYRWYPHVGRCRPRTDQEVAEMLKELFIDQKKYREVVRCALT